MVAKVKIFKEKDIDERGAKILCVLFLAALLIPLLMFLPSTEPIVDLETEGLKAEVKLNANIVNRFDNIPTIQWYESGPSVAGEYEIGETDYLYFNSFETSENMSAVDVIDGDIQQRKNPYHGEYSARVSSSAGQVTTIDFQQEITLPFNASADIVFFMNPRQNLGDGYIAAHYTLNTSYGMERVTILLRNSSTNGYVSQPDEIIIEQPIAGRYWQGIFINSVKGHSAYDLTEYEDDAQLLWFNITHTSSNAYSYYLDYVFIQLTPMTPAGIWYYDGSPQTDFQFDVEYTIYASSEAFIDMEDITLRVVFDTELSGEISLDFIIEVVNLKNLTWIEDAPGIFDYTAEGIYNSRLHPLPYRPYWGENLIWEFNANVSVFGELINGEITRDDKTVGLQTFDTDWTIPIELVDD